MEELGGQRTLNLDVAQGSGDDDLDLVLKALASAPRRRILSLLADRLHNVTEIARALDIPVSTANLHVGALEDAGLLLTEHRPASRGLQKVCTRAYDRVVLRLPGPAEARSSTSATCMRNARARTSSPMPRPRRRCWA